MKSAKFTPLTVSDKLNVCDVTTTLNRIEIYLGTEGSKQLMDSGQCVIFREFNVKNGAVLYDIFVFLLF